VVSLMSPEKGRPASLRPCADLAWIRRAAIAVENVDIGISESAIKAEEETPGEPADAVVWEGLEQSAGEETRLSITYLCFMMVATHDCRHWSDA